MKKLLLLTLALTGLNGFAQNTFKVVRAGTSTSVAPNATITAATVPATLTTLTFDMENTSNTTNVYNVVRYDIVLHRVNNTDTSEARYCFASQCYGAGTFVAPVQLTLNPNQNTATMGDYFSLDADYWEASTKAFAMVKYTLFNVNVPADSLQFTIRYNNELFGVGIREQKLNNTLSFYPNPAKDLTTVFAGNGFSAESSLKLYNSLGQAVYNRKMNAGAQEINIDLSALPSGVYIAELREGTKISTKKLIVE